MNKVYKEGVTLEHITEKARRFREEKGDYIHEQIVTAIYRKAEKLAQEVVGTKKENTRGWSSDWERKMDDIVTSKVFGFPLMLCGLGFIFWLTIYGANYPSELLASLLFSFEAQLSRLFLGLGSPEWLHGLLVLGIYRSVAWVIAVMLPPMAIFFPIFTLLEDLGYLPRVAFNLDKFFKLAGAHGKQALTMAMGFGCNAAGVISARIIDSPRERVIAILTNSFIPCNGRFPMLIALSTIFMGAGAASHYHNLTAAAITVLLVITGIAATLLVSWLLSRTLLKGVPSSFALELPPYRKPLIIRVIVRSIFDRTAFVLCRAIIVAAPAGAVTWLVANVYIGEQSILNHVAAWLEPFGGAIGLDGFIILAFMIGLPANEIVIPILLMSYLSAGSMLELESLEAMRELFVSRGWTWVTALNMMLFTLLHFPCGTTLLTIFKETGSWKWTFSAIVITTLTAVAACFLVAWGASFLKLV